MEICPFVHGRALRPKEFYNRDGELRRLVGRLATGQSAALIGQPHSGKTSFLNYVQDISARRKISGNTLDHCVFSYIDSQMLGHSFDQTAFWEQALRPLNALFVSSDTASSAPKQSIQKTVSELVQEEKFILQHGGIPKAIESSAIIEAYDTAKHNHFGTFTLEQLFQVIGREGRQFVLLLDEFDALLTHPVLNKTEFYGSLRSLCSRCSGFAMVLASRHSLELLNQETQKINPHGSPYFNVFTELRLGPLPEVYANAVINQAKRRFGSLDRAFIAKTSGLHPFLLQTAASILWELHLQGKKGRDRYELAGDEMYRQTRSHFSDTWNTWSRAEQKVLTFLALAQINGIVGEHYFHWKRLIGNLSDYNAELRILRDTGTIVKTGASSWKLTQESFLWWWVDRLKSLVRERDSSDFDKWLCAQELDGMFTKEESSQLSEAAHKIKDVIGEGAGTLIQSFARGLAEKTLG
ncbi:hypothetical protein CSB45_11925 [candidate division KSB3 bacterium]|uniref:Novel STAND NTPase 2 domain-containing protein n=1 Tax=candidate division KSB3 bacterium TaxID=2044937 RepID=A0A2G6E2T7_9BACT|nr:MAG: hypothetical protein CSB45_11925 [candidate division KSB3 bacterium]PIE29237.1 MAG: hypothetical protein CSA57_09525 [candidate division KSB3 bacterium]